MDSTGEELFCRIKQNEQVALEKLHRKYYQPLCSFSYSYVKEIHTAEEVVSDVFLNLWIKRDSIHISSSIKSYLYTSVRNHSINSMNAQKHFFETLENHPIEYESIDHRADAKINYTETYNQIEKIIRELPPQRQTIFRLNRIDGLKYKEIAEILSISVNTVQKQMTEAVKHISKYYSEKILVLFTLIR
nr:RNA polymerase sigma-70 factor [uncultured Draconibacterium sp.]